MILSKKAKGVVALVTFVIYEAVLMHLLHLLAARAADPSIFIFWAIGITVMLVAVMGKYLLYGVVAIVFLIKGAYANNRNRSRKRRKALRKKGYARRRAA